MTLHRWWAGLLAMVLLAASVGLREIRERAYPRPMTDQPLTWITSGSALPRAALGFDALVADLYWIRAVQHYGRERQRPAVDRTYSRLFEFVDLTTTLDPHFVVAYQFGALFLAEPAPNGPGRLDQAMALLEKGRRVDPSRWQYPQYLGFLHYWYAGDPVAAGRQFEAAARLPGAPNWMQTVATSMYLKGGDGQAATLLLREMAESDDRWIREWARARLSVGAPR
ncbi:MAG: hypothetical protein AMXMBFR57_30930 [Acidimicrobiia bacterium]